MADKISIAEFEGKTIEELREILEDEVLLSLDDQSNVDLILKITELIIEKENKTEEQQENERVAFWARLLAQNGNRLPIRLEDVIEKRTVSIFKPRFRYHKALVYTTVRRVVAAVVVILALFIGNTVLVQAFNLNVLHVITKFTDNLFNKTFVSEENEDNIRPDIGAQPDGINSNTYESLQDALEVYGISEIQAPDWLPDNYHFTGVQVSYTSERDIIASIYENGDKSIVINVIKYSESPSDQTRAYEKSKGTPFILSYNGVDHYIFSNLDKTVATWTNGMSECDIQGDVSLEEMKTIIKSMYKKD